LLSFKVKFSNLQSEKEKLEDLLDTKGTSEDHTQLLQLKYKTYQLEQENKDLRQKLHIDDSEHQSAPDPPKTVDKSFQEQIPVSDDHYKIPIAIRNKMVGASDGDSGRVNSINKFQMADQNLNVLQQPLPLNSKSTTTTTTTPTSVVKKDNLMSPPKASSTVKTSARVKPLPKGLLS
jgi:hypothetical protein